MEIFVLGPLDNNAILFASEKTKKAAVVDPSFGSYKKISLFAKEHNLEIEAVLITHGHFDHIADASFFQKEGAKVYVHKNDQDKLLHPHTKDFGFEIIGVRADVILEGEESFSIGEITVKVIETPGHTKGSICYYLPEENLLFSGDTLFQGTMGRISFTDSDPKKMWNSLKKLSELPKDTKVIPGHGPSTSIGEEPWLKKPEEKFS